MSRSATAAACRDNGTQQASDRPINSSQPFKDMFAVLALTNPALQLAAPTMHVTLALTPVESFV